MYTPEKYTCLECEQQPTRPFSKFCSLACYHAFTATMPFVACCTSCSADEGNCESVAEAEIAGWQDVEEDAEGVSWNYLGTCPRCAALVEVKPDIVI